MCSFAGEQTCLFEGMQAALLQGRRSCRGEHLARIGDAKRVESSAQPLEAVNFVRVKHFGQEIAFLNADTMLAGAGTAEPFIFLDNCDFQAQLPRANRGHIAARTAADYRYIELFVSQFGKSPLKQVMGDGL